VPLNTLAEHTLGRCIYNGTYYDSPLNNIYTYVTSHPQFDCHRYWRPDGINFDGKNFFLKITRMGKKANWFFYLQMAGSEAEAVVYTATIFVFNSEAGFNGRNSHRFIGEVCPIDVVGTEKAAEGGYCQILTDDQMSKLFSEQEKKFSFSVRVELTKEELVVDMDGDSVVGEETSSLAAEDPPAVEAKDNSNNSASTNRAHLPDPDHEDEGGQNLQKKTFNFFNAGLFIHLCPFCTPLCGDLWVKAVKYFYFSILLFILLKV